MSAVTEQLQVESDRVGAEFSAQVARSQQASEAMVQASAARLQQNRIAAVRVLGVSTGGAKPLVLVNLGSSNLRDA